MIPVSDILETLNASLNALNASLDEITLLLGKLVAASTALWLALAPVVKLASKGSLPKWFSAVVVALSKLSGPFAVNGEPLKKKK